MFLEQVNRHLDQVLRVCENLSRYAVWIVGALFLLSVAFICTEIAMRRILGFSLRGAHEYSGYTLAICTSWALAWALFKKAHIRIELIHARAPAWLQGILSTLALLLFCCVIALAVYFAWDVVSTSWARQSRANTPLGTPLWIPQSIWLLGLVWFAICLALITLRSFIAILQGDRATVGELADSLSLDQEIAETRAALGDHGQSADIRPPEREA